MDAVEGVVDLHTAQLMNSASHHLYGRTIRTKNSTFPSLKKYLGCRTNEPPAASAPGYVLVGTDVMVFLGLITWEEMFIARDPVAWGAPWIAEEVTGSFFLFVNSEVTNLS